MLIATTLFTITLTKRDKDREGERDRQTGMESDGQIGERKANKQTNRQTDRVRERDE